MTAAQVTPRSFGPWWAIAIAAAALAAHAWRFLPIFDDDAFISLRYADRLLNGHGLTWTDGPRVEGYSNLLWILLIAAIGRFGADLVVAARTLGVILTIGAIAAVAYSGPRHSRSALLPLSLGALALPIATPIAVWSIAGLEQPLVACLLAWALTLIRGATDDSWSQKRWAFASVLLGLLCLTRPDSPVLVLAILLGAAMTGGRRKGSIVRVITLAAGPLLAIVGQQIFRVAYYGQWVSNPALVKIAFTARRLETGMDYLAGGYAALWPVVALAVLALACNLSAPQLRRRQYPILFIAALWSLYLIVVGGDIFAAWRQFVPLILCMSFVITDAACYIHSSAAAGKRTAMFLVVSAALGAGLWTQSRDFTNQRALAQHSEWRSRTMGLMLKRTFGDAAPLVAVDAAGSTPYWSQLPALDMLGLNDPYLPHHPPPDFGKGLIGHELGDGAYVLERKPDLVIFRGPPGQRNAVYLSGRQMQASQDFAREYSLVTFESLPPESLRSYIWMRRSSPKIGIRSKGSEILIPAFLLLSQPPLIGRETESGRFAISLDASATLRVDRIAAPPGPRRLTTEPETPISAAITAGDRLIAEGVTPIEFSIPTDAGPEITIAVQSAAPVELEMIKLTR